jgi:hypothetical protein
MFSLSQVAITMDYRYPGRVGVLLSTENEPDTVGQPPSTEIGVPNMPALQANKLSKHPREKVLLEL